MMYRSTKQYTPAWLLGLASVLAMLGLSILADALLAPYLVPQSVERL